MKKASPFKIFYVSFIIVVTSVMFFVQIREKMSVTNYNSGIDFLEQHEYDLAIRAYGRAIRWNHKFRDAYNSRGFAKYNRGIAKHTEEDYKGAIDDYTKAIELDSMWAHPYNNRGLAKDSLQDYQGAIADFSKAIKLDYDYIDAYNNRGLAKDLLQDYQGAIADFDEAIKIANASISFKDAAKFYKAIMINQKAEAYFNRGLINYKHKDFRGSVADFDKAIEANPKKAEAFFFKGLANYNLLDCMGSIADFDKAIKIDPLKAEAYYFRGLSKIESGQPESGYLDLSQAKKLGYSDANEAIKKLIIQLKNRVKK